MIVRSSQTKRLQSVSDIVSSGPGANELVSYIYLQKLEFPSNLMLLQSSYNFSALISALYNVNYHICTNHKLEKKCKKLSIVIAILCVIYTSVEGHTANPLCSPCKCTGNDCVSKNP